MQQQIKTESVFTTANQIRDFVEGLFSNWIKPAVVDPKRQQRLEDVAGLVGNVLADTDPTTGAFIYPNIRKWIQDQSVPFRWRELKQVDANGNEQSYKPRRFAPSDEDAIAAIAAAAGIPDQIPVPLPLDQYIAMKEAVARFLSRIEKGAEQKTVTYVDWVRTIDDVTHDTTMTKVVDFMSACGVYGKDLEEWFDGVFAGLIIDPAIFAKIKNWFDGQSKKRKDLKILPGWLPWWFKYVIYGLLGACGLSFLVWLIVAAVKAT